jgi:hypothetical protein
MAISPHSANSANSARSMRVIFSREAPLTLDALRAVLERHSDEIAMLESRHAALATIHVGDHATLALSLAVDGSELAGPACELETLAAVHGLERDLAADGFSLRSVRRAA